MKCMRLLCLGIALIFTMGALTPRIAAQPHRPVGVERPEVVKHWQERLSKIELQLEAGEWKKARNAVNFLLEEMCDRIESGEGVARLLGIATFFRGVAEAGLGNEADANWDYTTAQSLVPMISQVELTKFGAAGEMLKPWRIEEKDSAESGSEDEPDTEPRQPLEKQGDAETAEGKVVKPPKKIHSPKPKYPFAKLSACIDGPIKVQVIIDEEGHPTHPKLLSTQNPLLSFAALEALREWRFKPAKMEGEPVAVYYNLKVNFKLGRCTNLFAQPADG